MAQQRSHVPKFGSWDKDNIPYTAYFENARKERGGERMMNPNDPEENPDAFLYRAGGDVDLSPVHLGVFRKASSAKSGSRNIIASDFPSHKTKSAPSFLQAAVHRINPVPRKTDTNINMSFSSRHCPSDENYHRAASVPKFGSWDETDPRSGEGYTIVFNRVKKEKQIASTTFAPLPTQASKPSGSRVCCWCCRWFRRRNE